MSSTCSSIGFDDCWGELNRTAANAVADFIDNTDGKSILFTHEHHLVVNLPLTPYQATSGTVSTSTWGYYFNTLLRMQSGWTGTGVTNTAIRRHPVFAGEGYKHNTTI
jgi:hypothetical protein